MPGSMEVFIPLRNEAALRPSEGRHHFSTISANLFFINTSDPCAEMPGNIPRDVKEKLDADWRMLKRRIREEGHTPEVTALFEDYERRQAEYNGAKITDAQADYFERVLNENKDVRWTFVLMHNRIWKQKHKPEAWMRLEKLLADRSHTVFGGHEHFHEHTEIDGTAYIGMATAGGGWIWPKNKPGVYDHIVWVTMEDGGPVIGNILANEIRDPADVRSNPDGDTIKAHLEKN